MTSAGERELMAEDLENARRAIEYCYEQGWTDGLPVVPPIQSFVDEFLAQTKRDPDEVVLAQSHLNRECTVRDAAVNAVMAGCRPEYFPVFLAALDAFRDVGGGGGLLQSTTGQAQAIIVNGPVRQRIGLNCAENIFGPGDRANSTIGRALRLTVLNTLDVRPHDLDQSTQGTPGKYAICIGEHEEESPWEPLHVELGFPAEASTATIQMTRSALHVEHRSTQVPEEILQTIARSMSYPGQTFEAPPFNKNNGCIVVMGPEHAGIIAAGGWTKQQVRQFLWEHWGNTARDLRECGKTWELEGVPDDAFVRASAAPESVKIVVSGANNAGVSTVLVGFVSRSGTRPVEEV